MLIGAGLPARPDVAAAAAMMLGGHRAWGCVVAIADECGACVGAGAGQTWRTRLALREL